MTHRLKAIDALLPSSPKITPGCGAVTSCEHWEGEPGSLDLSWGTARRFKLTPRVAGPDVRAELDEAITRWRDHLAATPGTGDPDTAAVLTWPSRDVEGVVTLLDRGFAPLAVIAARPARPAAEPVVPPGIRIRRAGPADLDAVVRLGMEVVRYDAHFGGVVERPSSEPALRREAADWLAEPEPWIWLAERDGAPIGLLTVERPERAAWIAPLTGPDPVAYLMLMAVLPGDRGAGVGAALVAHYHRVAERAGIAVTLLHYAQLNPLSAPFWSRHGYRPLWTAWEVRPANAIR